MDNILGRMIDDLIRTAQYRQQAIEDDGLSQREYLAELEEADRDLFEARELLLSTIRKLSK